MLIDRKHAVGIAIERGTHISVCLAYLLLQVHHVFWLDRTCRMMREIAVKLEVKRNKFAGQVLEDAWNHHTGHAVASVDDDFKRLNLAHVDE